MMALLPGDGEKSSFGRKMVARLTSIGKGERERRGKRATLGVLFLLPVFPVAAAASGGRSSRVRVVV